MMHICYLCDDSQSWWWSLSFLLLILTVNMLWWLNYTVITGKRSLYCILHTSRHTAVTEIWTVLKGWCYLTEITETVHIRPKEQSKGLLVIISGGLLEYNQLLCKIQDNTNVRSCPGVFVLQSGSSLFQHDSTDNGCPGVWTKQKKYYGQETTVSHRMMTGNKLCTSDVVICCCWSFTL